MKASVILRLPTPSLPKEALTGDPTLDSFLLQADRGLVGAWSVRRPYMLELRDHLLASRDAKIEAGSPHDDASKEATDGLGEIQPLVAEQKAFRARMFGISATIICLGGGGVLALMFIAIGLPNALTIAALTALPAGLITSYALSYAIGPPATPVKSATGGRTLWSGFEVRHSPSAFLAGCLLLGAAVTATILLLAGVAGRGPLAGMPILGGLFAIPAAMLAWLASTVFATTRVDEEALVHRGLWKSVTIPLTSIRKIQSDFGLASLIGIPPGRKIRIEWDNGVGDVKSLTLRVDGGMINLDRLLATLDRQRGLDARDLE